MLAPLDAEIVEDLRVSSVSCCGSSRIPNFFGHIVTHTDEHELRPLVIQACVTQRTCLGSHSVELS
jgi:hypothetical protein